MLFLRFIDLKSIVYLNMATLPAGGLVMESVIRPCANRTGISRLSSVPRTTVLPANKSMSNIRSDTEDAGPDVVSKSFGAETVLRRRDDRTIHSGHFMLSHVHDDSSPAESSREDVIDDDSDVEIVIPGGSSLGGKDAGGGMLFETDFEPASILRSTTSHLAIDTSLTKLFECMTLAYRSDSR